MAKCLLSVDVANRTRRAERRQCRAARRVRNVTYFVNRWVSAQIVARAILPWRSCPQPAFWKHGHSPKARKGRLKGGLQPGLAAPGQSE